MRLVARVGDSILPFIPAPLLAFNCFVLFLILFVGWGKCLVLVTKNIPLPS